MATRKATKEEKVKYLLKPLSWSIDHSFGVGYYLSGLSENDMSETHRIIVDCELQSPIAKKVKIARVTLLGTHVFDSILEKEHQNGEVDSIGVIGKSCAKEKLDFDIWVPAKFLKAITLALGFNKVEYISIFGEKLWYGKGGIYQVYFGTIDQFDFSEE